jgi:hypothetical protein
MFPRTARDVLLIVALLLPLGCTRARVVTAQDVIETAPDIDGAHLVLVGRVQDPRTQTAKSGGAYTTFIVADGTGRVPVFARGTERIGAGDLGEVRGTFHRQAHLEGDLLSDTIEADALRLLSQAAQPPGTPVGPP